MSGGSYYVPAMSKWPILGSITLGTMAIGGGMVMVHGSPPIILLLGFAGILTVMALWFRDVVAESRQGFYNQQMDRSFRWGMAWFIFSEVMFFGAFFCALFYVRVFALPWLDGEGAKGVAALLWPEFSASWPLMSPPGDSVSGPREVMSPWQLPLVNTLLLVGSSITLTIAHEGLKEGHRALCRNWLFVTLLLGLVFIVIQGVEYYQAVNHYGITLEAGIYGTTFFMLTGFHGVHVIIGVTILIVMFIRVLRGHFSSDEHFGFEAACWYWHFVDVVWIGLFLFVYVF